MVSLLNQWRLLQLLYMRDDAAVAILAHTQKVVSSILTPATMSETTDYNL